MPKRGLAANPRSPASALFSKLVAQGVEPSSLIIAARNYSDACDRDGTEAKFVQQAETFLGPKKETWKQYLSATTGGRPSERPSKLAYREAYVAWKTNGENGPAPDLAAYEHLDRGAA